MISVEFISSNDRDVHLHKFLNNGFVTLGVIAAYLFFKKITVALLIISKKLNFAPVTRKDITLL